MILLTKLNRLKLRLCLGTLQSDGLRFDRKDFHVNSVSMAKRIVLILFCICAGLISYVALDFWASKNGKPDLKFAQLWQEDVELLESSQKLPKAWYSVKEIEVYPGDAQAKVWMKSIHPPIKKNPNGQFKMEILVLTWEEAGKVGSVIQYDLVDLKTQNLVWELGRTLILKSSASSHHD